EALTNAIQNTPKQKKVVLFFDELPWMATKNSKLLQSLDYYWNQHWSKDKRIKLIICGSSAAWIIQKVIKNKGGLHNRLTRTIYLTPFKLSETKDFLLSMKLKLTDAQILLLYMVMGGIPYYLAKIPKNLSATQIIQRLAFQPKSFLAEEFDNLFASLFDADDGFYVKAVKLIAGRRDGIGKNELLKKMGKALMGSTGLKKLQELEETGFIKGFKPSYHERQGTYYRINDEYILFYLKWIEPIHHTLQEDALEANYWESMALTPEWQSWLGYAFEAVCYKHLALIRKALQLNSTAQASSWRYVPRKGSKEQGAQIDLLFDRKDAAVTLCEIKYSQQPYVVNKEMVESLNRKIKSFKEKTRTKKQLFLALISANGIKNNSYADDLLSGTVTAEDLFKD
ncbi:MAG: AAA family ATPase, partial [Gammaproteobacteria bacterium]|nr:AAA family ATPase [Gammaproteobacteria bacterium]